MFFQIFFKQLLPIPFSLFFEERLEVPVDRQGNCDSWDVVPGNRPWVLSAGCDRSGFD